MLFILDHVDGEEQSQLIKLALEMLHEHGADVRAVVLDGCYANQKSVKLLGAKLDFDNFEPSFRHPISCDKVSVIFDPCHMLKLMRNLLGDHGILIDKQGQCIKWEYLVRLNEVQRKEGLHLANKLRSSHLDYKSKPMNVKLAAQTFSESVASALDFMRSIGDTRFNGSEATSKFLRQIDFIFDRLNISNPKGLGSKSPITRDNIEAVSITLQESIDYLMNLKLTNGMLIRNSRRKTGLIGFKCAAYGILAVARYLLFRDENPYSYFLSYKLSQDHIETLFSLIRRRGGWNNNPNVLQVRTKEYQPCTFLRVLFIDDLQMVHSCL